MTPGPPEGDKSPRQHTELWDGDHKAQGLWTPRAQEPHTKQGLQSIQSQNFPLSVLGSATHSCSRDARKRGIYQAPDARSLPGVSDTSQYAPSEPTGLALGRWEPPGWGIRISGHSGSVTASGDLGFPSFPAPGHPAGDSWDSFLPGATTQIYLFAEGGPPVIANYGLIK